MTLSEFDRCMVVYEIAVDRLLDGGYTDDVLHFGPSHIVWEDGNWDLGSIEFCLSAHGKYRYDLYARFSDVEMQICKDSLEQLREVLKGGAK